MNYSKDKTYLVAVSGGPDSMALLSMLIKENYHIIVAHVNYHTRDASNQEEVMVNKFCNINNVKCYTLDTSTLKRKGNFEAWARKVRYEFFQEIYFDQQCDALFVAHHQDDLIETYLMQKRRRGYVSYYGIKEETTINNMVVIRPLLSYRKKNLEDYCSKNDVPYSIDISNLETKYLRNKIRHEIVEKLSDEELFIILQEIKEKNEKLSLIKEKIDSLMANSSLSISEVLSLDDDVFNMYFYEYVSSNIYPEKINLSFTKIFEMKKALKSDKAYAEVALSSKYFFIKEYDKYYVGEKKKEDEFSYVMDEPSFLDTKEFSCDFRIDTSFLKIYKDSYPLTFRNARKDDVVKIGKIHKKVNRLLIDEKVPQSKRKNYPIVVDKEEKVVYLPLYNSLNQKNIALKLKFVLK